MVRCFLLLFFFSLMLTDHPLVSGMHLLIYFTCAYYLIREKKKGNWKWLAYITLLLALGTLNISINMHLEEVEWINERNFPGGPLAHLFASQRSALNIAGDVISDLAPIFADSLLVSAPTTLFVRHPFRLSIGLSSVRGLGKMVHGSHPRNSPIGYPK